MKFQILFSWHLFLNTRVSTVRNLDNYSNKEKVDISQERVPLERHFLGSYTPAKQ